MKMNLLAVLASGVLMLGIVNIATATSFTVNGSDSPSAYTISGPGGISSQPVNAAPPAGPWVTGAWLAPQSDQSWPMDSTSGNLPGVYDYVTTFNLNGLNPSTAILGGAWATDDSGVLYLNGIQASTSNGYSSLSNFHITSGFTSGINTLEFKVTNNPYLVDPGINPTGLLVTFNQAEAAPVPEPGTMMLLGFGMLGLAVYGKRRMKKEA